MTFLPGTDLVALDPGVLRTLRRSLERVLGDQAAPLLQEAGFASGDALYAGLAAWLTTHTDYASPEEIDASRLGQTLSAFFDELGWGPITLEPVGPAALALDAPRWAEAMDEVSAEVPSCHVTTGLLAAVLGRMAGDVVAVMEVECRSRGDQSCRFLIGSPDTLQAVFDGMSRGEDYEAVLTASPAS